MGAREAENRHGSKSDLSRSVAEHDGYDLRRYLSVEVSVSGRHLLQKNSTRREALARTGNHFFPASVFRAWVFPWR